MTPAGLEDPLASRDVMTPFAVLRALPLDSLGPLEASERESSTTAPRRGGAIGRRARGEDVRTVNSEGSRLSLCQIAENGPGSCCNCRNGSSLLSSHLDRKKAGPEAAGRGRMRRRDSTFCIGTSEVG